MVLEKLLSRDRMIRSATSVDFTFKNGFKNTNSAGN